MKVTAARASTRNRTARKLTTASAVARRPSAYPAGMHKQACALLAMAALLAACGGGKNGSSAKGAKVYASAGCGGCHTLSAAKSTGQTGPNLDQVKPSYDAIVRQVSNGGGGMPSFTGKLSTG